MRMPVLLHQYFTIPVMLLISINWSPIYFTSMLFLNLSLPVTQWYHNSPSTQDRNLGVILFPPFLLTSLSSPSASVLMLPCKYVSNLKGSLPHHSQVANPNFQHLLHLIGVSVSPCAFCISSFLKVARRSSLNQGQTFSGLKTKPPLAYQPWIKWLTSFTPNPAPTILPLI